MKQINIPKQYFGYIHYYYLYNHKHLPKNYVLKWKKYLDFPHYNSLERYYSFFTKKEWKQKLKELPEYHKYITKLSKKK